MQKKAYGTYGTFSVGPDFLKSCLRNPGSVCTGDLRIGWGINPWDNRTEVQTQLERTGVAGQAISEDLLISVKFST